MKTATEVIKSHTRLRDEPVESRSACYSLPRIDTDIHGSRLYKSESYDARTNNKNDDPSAISAPEPYAASRSCPFNTLAVATFHGQTDRTGPSRPGLRPRVKHSRVLATTQTIPAPERRSRHKPIAPRQPVERDVRGLVFDHGLNTRGCPRLPKQYPRRSDVPGTNPSHHGNRSNGTFAAWSSTTG